MAQLKLDGTKLFNAMNYINEINYMSLLDIDFSDLFDDKKDLTAAEKESYFWGCERLSNMEIINRIMNDKNQN